MPENEEITERYHANKLQLLPLLYRPRILIALLGRGTGKTEEITVDRLYEFIHLMPGGITLVGCDSFKHLNETIMPAIFTSLKKKHLLENVHFWVNTFPPEGVPRPLQVITEPDGFVFFDTGHAVCYVSTNFQSHSNGKSVDSIIWEEAKLLKWERVKETNLMNRGNKQYFGDLWCHHSLTVVSDMSDDPDHWTYRYDANVNLEILRLIASLDYQQAKLMAELDTCKVKRRIDVLENQIANYETRLHFWRRKAVLVLEGSSIQNMHVLGYDVITDYLSNPRQDVMLNVLSIRPLVANKYFYQYLKDDIHGVVYKDWEYIRTLRNKTVLDCRIDTGSNENLALEVCMDYNNNIISLGYGQMFKKVYRLLGEFFSEDPTTPIEDCVQKFCHYHRFRKNKSVKFYYDANADWIDASRKVTYKDSVVKAFLAEEWEILTEKFPITTHDERFTIWRRITTNDPTAPFSLEYETENCTSWYKAAKRTIKVFRTKMVTDKKTKAKVPKQVIEKYKATENDKLAKKIPLQEQPHITEAMDGLIVANFLKLTQKQRFRMPIK